VQKTHSCSRVMLPMLLPMVSCCFLCNASCGPMLLHVVLSCDSFPVLLCCLSCVVFGKDLSYCDYQLPTTSWNELSYLILLLRREPQQGYAIFESFVFSISAGLSLLHLGCQVSIGFLLIQFVITIYNYPCMTTKT
jgi:hypothetical protein